MKLLPSSWNLAIGQTFSAWAEYPAIKSKLIAAVPQRPLLVSGAYRSGTSWLGHLLTTDATWHVHEPFSPRAGFLKENFAYRRHWETDTHIDNFVAGLLSGRKTRNNGVQLLRHVYANRPFTPAALGLYADAPRRVLIKDPLACLLTEYLVRKHEFRAVLIIRHPAGFVSSLQQLGWDTATELKQFLRNEPLMADWLNPHMQALQLGADRGDVIAHATLYGAIWTVLNQFQVRNNDVTVISYERLCEDPAGQVDLLCKLYGLDETLSDVTAPSTAELSNDVESSSDRPFSLIRNTKKMPHIWRDRLNANAVKVTREIWGQFGLPYYLSDSDWYR